MKKYLFLILPIATFATSLEIHLGSFHFENKTDIGYRLNDLNLGVAIEKNNIIFGGYYNSLENTSIYLAHQINLYENFYLQYGITTGYSEYFYKNEMWDYKMGISYKDYILMIGLSYHYKNLKISLIPSQKGLIHFSLIFKGL